ncbi:MAG: threonine/serine dehydratase, partial [Gemmatimonadota bacterium]|nr:threonine/serine dehydratase [Gemmatimonadota bacterium]
MPSSATAAAPATSDTISLVSLDEIRAAARVLHGVAVRTPLLPADELSAQLGGGAIFVKPEMLQRGGAFKFRGAYTFLAGLSASARERGVIAPSSGNHAQAVAFAARIFGIHATLVMPTTVTAAKRAGVERLGGRVVLAGITTADRMERAQQLVKESGSVLVPPYDDARIIAGQGTVGLEIVEDLPDVVTVLVPVGGGGLSAGVATAVKLLAPNTRVIGVEPAGAPKLTRARAAGAPVRLDSTGGLADGLLATQVGTIPFAHHSAYIDEVVTVEDADLAPAMRYLLDRLKIVTEPSGAITIAALQT